jgi:MSHA biogenesis protein MshP
MNMIVSNSSNSSNKLIATKQQGSALMLSLFVIIVLTLLGSALMRVLSTSSETIAQEVIGTRALMAANSAMQAELVVLFPLNSTTNVCNSANSYDLQYSGSDVEGLNHCEAATTCDNYFTDTVNSVEYFRLTSTGKCGSGFMESNSKAIVKSSRSIQVEARSL